MTKKTMGQEEDDEAIRRWLHAHPNLEELERWTIARLAFLAGKAYGLSLRGCAGRPCVCPYCGHLWISHNALGCCWDEECNCNKAQGQEDKAP